MIACGRSEQKLNLLVADMEAEGVGIAPLVMDVTSDEGVQSALERVSALLDEGLHVVVNNAYSGGGGAIWQQTPAEYQAAMDVTVGGPVRILHEARRFLEKAGGKSGASIINVASMYGMVSPNPALYEGGHERFHNPPAYGAAKAALIQWTRYAAAHLAGAGIRVNALSPGPFPNASVQAGHPDFCQRLEASSPLGRIGEPGDLAGSVVLLASNDSRYITGQNLVVDGGWTAW